MDTLYKKNHKSFSYLKNELFFNMIFYDKYMK